MRGKNEIAVAALVAAAALAAGTGCRGREAPAPDPDAWRGREPRVTLQRPLAAGDRFAWFGRTRLRFIAEPPPPVELPAEDLPVALFYEVQSANADGVILRAGLILRDIRADIVAARDPLAEAAVKDPRAWERFCDVSAIIGLKHGEATEVAAFELNLDEPLPVVQDFFETLLTLPFPTLPAQPVGAEATWRARSGGVDTPAEVELRVDGVDGPVRLHSAGGRRWQVEGKVQPGGVREWTSNAYRFDADAQLDRALGLVERVELEMALEIEGHIEAADEKTPLRARMAQSLELARDPTFFAPH